MYNGKKREDEIKGDELRFSIPSFSRRTPRFTLFLFRSLTNKTAVLSRDVAFFAFFFFFFFTIRHRDYLRIILNEMSVYVFMDRSFSFLPWELYHSFWSEMIIRKKKKVIRHNNANHLYKICSSPIFNIFNNILFPNYHRCHIFPSFRIFI